MEAHALNNLCCYTENDVSTKVRGRGYDYRNYSNLTFPLINAHRPFLAKIAIYFPLILLACPKVLVIYFPLIINAQPNLR